MGTHSADKDGIANEGLDGLIRWALHDAVAGAEPSPQAWERIRQRATHDMEAASVPAWCEALHGALRRYMQNLCLLIQQPEVPPESSWQAVIRARALAETRVCHSWDLRFC